MNRYKYERASLRPGIVHFGVGNFHRAHLEYYQNRLLEYEDQRCWAVSGAMVLPSDERLFKALKADDCEYELTVCSPDGHRECWQIGSLTELNWGCEDPEAIVRRIADPATCIVTLTITETTETSSIKENSFSLEAQLVVNFLGAKAGFGYGHGENWSTTHTDGVGSVVSAEVLGPTKIGDQNIPNFYWNFCKYNYRLNGQEFPVVNFIVKRK